MTTLDEIFAAMPDAAAEDAHEVLYIDPATRQIDIPAAEAILGVESDGQTERKYFACPRYVGAGIDLAACFLRVNYRNANGDVDAYLVQDAAVKGEYVTFSWELSRNVTAYKGKVLFVVCAILPGSTATYPEWNTTTASGEVLEGLEPDGAAAEAATADVIAQLLALVDRQAAAVTAEGSTQIAAVQKAAQEAANTAQEAIAAKGAATLATIPDDYTTLTGKVNNLANAVKGTLRGEIVRADDVSPVEHYPAVKVRSKNLWNMAAVTDTDVITNNGNGSVTIAPNTYYATTSKRLRDICPELRAGDVVTLSMDTDGCGFINLNEIDGVINSGETLTITEECLSSVVALYGTYASKEDYGRAHTVQHIQLELGTAATEYTPYIAPETVTVTRCGKNLAYKNDHNITGIAYSTGSIGGLDKTVLVKDIPIVAGASYVVSMDKPAGVTTPRVFLYNGKLTAVTHTAAYNELIHNSRGVEKVALNGAIVNTGEYDYIAVTTGGASTFEAGAVSFDIYNVQLEEGNAVTEYEPYNGATATPAEDGAVGGLTSLAPTMCLLTDTPGVIVECEYNRDTGKVIQRLVDAIQALGGTV